MKDDANKVVIQIDNADFFPKRQHVIQSAYWSHKQSFYSPCPLGRVMEYTKW